MILGAAEKFKHKGKTPSSSSCMYFLSALHNPHTTFIPTKKYICNGAFLVSTALLLAQAHTEQQTLDTVHFIERK